MKVCLNKTPPNRKCETEQTSFTSTKKAIMKNTCFVTDMKKAESVHMGKNQNSSINMGTICQFCRSLSMSCHTLMEICVHIETCTYIFIENHAY